MDLSFINIENWQERALSYCVVSNEYEAWVPVLKSRIRNEEDLGLGTFIAATAFLKDSIPQAHMEEVERQITLNNEYRQYCNQIETRKKNRINLCTKWATVFSFFGALLLIFINFSSDLSTSLFCTSQFWSCVYGTLIFSLIGGFSIGYIIACSRSLLSIKEGTAMIISCLLGLLSAFLCPACPPVSLIFAWAAFHLSDYLKPRLINESRLQSVYKKTHGIRVFADNPRAPEYVKNALRLAGIYQNSDSYIKNIVDETLSRKQSDYGAFLAYEAYLLDYHNNHDRESIYKDIYKNNNFHNDIEQNSEKKDYTNLLSRLCGVLSAILISVIFGLIIIINKDIVAAKIAGCQDFILYFICLGFVLISIVVGILASRRVSLTYGIEKDQKVIISICRCSWFSAWINLILIALIIIFTFIN